MRQGELWPPAEGARCFADGAWLLPGFALPDVARLLESLAAITAAAPFRHMRTPGGKRMSAAMTSCGPLGWVTDRGGYRYEPQDPETGRPWPPMPPPLDALAARAAAAADYPGFAPDSCLVNRYAEGAGMTLHVDRDERDFTSPIVSVSLGLPMIFRFGGPTRRGPTQALPLRHGDVVVWGGPSRLCYHGVAPLKPGHHPLLGACRVNLTFRRAR